jgi:hypothetical protein
MHSINKPLLMPLGSSLLLLLLQHPPLPFVVQNSGVLLKISAEVWSSWRLS